MLYYAKSVLAGHSGNSGQPCSIAVRILPSAPKQAQQIGAVHHLVRDTNRSVNSTNCGGAATPEALGALQQNHHEAMSVTLRYFGFLGSTGCGQALIRRMGFFAILFM